MVDSVDPGGLALCGNGIATVTSLRCRKLIIVAIIHVAVVQCCIMTRVDLYSFCARQHNAIARICYRPSARPSVCHTGGSVKNG